MRIKNLLSLLALTMVTLLASCSDESEETASKPEASGNHVWKTQTDTLKTAKDVAGNLQKNLNQQKATLEDND